MSEAGTMTAPFGADAVSKQKARWLQLLLGFIVMMTISSPQYVWTLFTSDFQKTTGALLSQVQWTLTILIVIQTWLSPIQGWLVDRFGPKLLIGFGAVLSGLGWVAASQITTLTGLYASYGLLCGIGTGIVYIGIVGLMVKWFPDRRGFATGLVAAGYGFGAIFTTFPIADMVKGAGARQALLVFGVAFAAIGLIASMFLRAPPIDGRATALASADTTTTADFTPGRMIKTPVFWLMFLMFAMMSTGGLMVLAQFTAFAKAFGVNNTTTVTILGVTLAAIPTALSFDRITNGLTRPFFGWVSDAIGRENTMGLAFLLEGAAIATLLHYRTDPFMLVILSGFVFFAWGEIFSLFPSTLTDTFGAKNATANYGFLYMAQGVGSVLGAPVAAMIYEHTGNWLIVFGIVIAMDVLTGLLALFVLKPMRRRQMASVV